MKDDWAAVNKQQLHSEEEIEEELDDEGLDFEYEEPYVDEVGNNEVDQENIINVSNHYASKTNDLTDTRVIDLQSQFEA